MAPCDTSSLGRMTSAARPSSNAGYQRWTADQPRQQLSRAETMSNCSGSLASTRRLPLLDVAINQPLDRAEVSAMCAIRLSQPPKRREKKKGKQAK